MEKINNLLEEQLCIERQIKTHYKDLYLCNKNKIDILTKRIKAQIMVLNKPKINDFNAGYKEGLKFVLERIEDYEKKQSVHLDDNMWLLYFWW